MAEARWAKWRAEAASRTEPEPKMERWHRFQYGIRDKVDGQEHWHDLVSVRQATRALGLIKKFYE